MKLTKKGIVSYHVNILWKIGKGEKTCIADLTWIKR